MSRFPPPQREYFASFPSWAVGFWAVGVFGGLIGCLLLLLRSRLALPVLLASAPKASSADERCRRLEWLKRRGL